MNTVPAVTRSAGGSNTRRWTVIVGLVSVLSLLLWSASLSAPSPASAQEAPVDLGTAATFSVLGGQTVTNTGPSVLAGDVGVFPGTAITGFPPGTTAGVIHAGDTAAGDAQSDLTIAYNDAAGRAPTATIAGDLGGLTLTTGVYNASSSIGLTGTLTLDAQGDPNAAFIFQVGSTLTTASGSNINMINGAQPCNVFWQIGSSATLGTTSSFIGSILALTSITVTTGTTVEGRALARNGQVSLDSNIFAEPGCDIVPPTTTTTTTTVPIGTATGPTGPGNVGGPGPDDDFSSDQDELANTGPNPTLPTMIAAGAMLLVLGGLLAIVARDRRGSRRPPPTT